MCSPHSPRKRVSLHRAARRRGQHHGPDRASLSRTRPDLSRLRRRAGVDQSAERGRERSMPPAALILAPDWACEVLSPATRRLDLVDKRPVYAREGVPHLWLVDPAGRTLEEFELHDGQWLLIASAKDDDPISRSMRSRSAWGTCGPEDCAGRRATAWMDRALVEFAPEREETHDAPAVGAGRCRSRSRRRRSRPTRWQGGNGAHRGCSSIQSSWLTAPGLWAYNRRAAGRPRMRAPSRRVLCARPGMSRLPRDGQHGMPTERRDQS